MRIERIERCSRPWNGIQMYSLPTSIAQLVDKAEKVGDLASATWAMMLMPTAAGLPSPFSWLTLSLLFGLMVLAVATVAKPMVGRLLGDDELTVPPKAKSATKNGPKSEPQWQGKVKTGAGAKN